MHRLFYTTVVEECKVLVSKAIFHTDITVCAVPRHINSYIDTTRKLCSYLHTYWSPIMYTRKRQACMNNVLIDSMHRVLSYMHTYWTLVPIIGGNNWRAEAS